MEMSTTTVPEQAAPAVAAASSPPTVAFPSAAWFGRLAHCMNENRARQEQLGYVDCVAGFCVMSPDGARTFEVTFEEFEARDVREATGGESRADFILEASLATWREMIQNIAAGRGRPDLTHTLNYLSHRGTPLRLVSDDPLKSDLYFRYNQSLQEWFNASSSFDTRFEGNG